jgi:hypothetical protein
VTSRQGGRLIICCDRCPVRLDLGLEAVARARNRMPSGWINIDADRHFCPSCAQTISFVSLARARKMGTRLAPAA